jgi:Tfp pilus assembly protein PilF
MMTLAWMRIVAVGVGIMVLCLGTTACTKSKKVVRSPLPLEAGSAQRAVDLNEQGTQAYRIRDFEQAKKLFADTVAAVPQSGPAHYNYGLALNILGETEAARRQFMEAANLAPGDKVIWDSPALSPFGNPEIEEKKVAAPQNPNHRSGMGGRY